jgi:hypothetical protein
MGPLAKKYFDAQVLVDKERQALKRMRSRWVLKVMS